MLFRSILPAPSFLRPLIHIFQIFHFLRHLTEGRHPQRIHHAQAAIPNESTTLRPPSNPLRLPRWAAEGSASTGRRAAALCRTLPPKAKRCDGGRGVQRQRDGFCFTRDRYPCSCRALAASTTASSILAATPLKADLAPVPLLCPVPESLQGTIGSLVGVPNGENHDGLVDLDGPGATE